MPPYYFLIEVAAIIFLIVVFPLTLAFLARRMLGSPIGWPRSIVVAVTIELTWGALAIPSMTAAGVTLENPQAVPIFVLALAWAFALGVAALVLLEVVAPTGSIPTPLAALRNVRRSLRHLSRTLAILRIASRHGLAQFFRRSRRKGSTENGTPLALASALEDAGPTFVKLGQMLSTRSDLLPDEYVTALSRLQSQVRAAEWSTIRNELERVLGGSLDEHFHHIDEEPLAAASIAQVHGAVLRDGTPVVVKVQRPDARSRVLADAELIRSTVAGIESRTEWGKSLGITALADGFVASLTLELDYAAEQRHSDLIKKASLTAGAAFTIPEMYPKLSSATVLTMQRAYGTPIGAAAPLLATYSREEATELANRIFELILHQILVQGVFHADLHPGNILLGAEGEVILLDFGAVGILDRESRIAITRLLNAVDADDAVAAVEALSTMCSIPSEVDIHLLEREVGTLLTLTRSMRIDGQLFGDLFGLIRRHRIIVPPAVAAALRTITTLEGTLMLIDPDFNLVDSARRVAPSILSELVTARSVTQSFTSTAAALAGTVARLPRRIENLTASVDSGSFARQFHPFAHGADRSFLRDMVGEFQRTIIAVALIVASVALTVADMGPMLTSTVRTTTFVGLSLGVVAFVLTMRVLVRKFERGQHAESRGRRTGR
ncbi:ABC1 kinase family protein [Leifsonia sp. McL0607]|uniref:ABC1 kinase family protein n=1 Tax=Leifsonia sp. McL0607 TaxID=3415672 RepID=UPI003CEC2306